MDGWIGLVVVTGKGMVGNHRIKVIQNGVKVKIMKLNLNGGKIEHL